MSEMSLGKKLACYRKLSGMTQQQLGSYLNMSAQAVSKWENDQSEPDAAMLKTLASLYSISVDDLLDDSKSGPTSPDDVDAEAVSRTVNGSVIRQGTIGEKETMEMEEEKSLPEETEPDKENMNNEETLQTEEASPESEEASATGEEKNPDTPNAAETEIPAEELPEVITPSAEEAAPAEERPASEEVAELTKEEVTPEEVVSEASEEKSAKTNDSETTVSETIASETTFSEPAPYETTASEAESYEAEIFKAEEAPKEEETAERVTEAEKVEEIPHATFEAIPAETHAETRKRLYAERKSVHKTRAAGFAFGIISAAIACAVFTLIFWGRPIDNSRILTVLADIPLAYIVLSFVGCLFWHAHSKPLKVAAFMICAPSIFPKFVSRWEVENIAWLTVIKSILIILAFILGIAVFAVGFVFAIPLSVIMFPFVLKNINKKMKSLKAEAENL